jgi:hypothetical protein
VLRRLWRRARDLGEIEHDGEVGIDEADVYAEDVGGLLLEVDARRVGVVPEEGAQR